MEPLFRFALIRPAIAQDPARPSIRLAQDSTLQKALAEAAKGERPRETLREIVRKFVASADFIGSPDANPFSAELAALASLLDRLERQRTVGHADVVKAVNQPFVRTQRRWLRSVSLTARWCACGIAS